MTTTTRMITLMTMLTGMTITTTGIPTITGKGLPAPTHPA
jgi:hypothetical protein